MRVPTSSITLTGLLVAGALLGYSAAPARSIATPGVATAVADHTAAPAVDGAVAPRPAGTDVVDRRVAAVLPAADPDDAPYYAEGSQYTARFDQTHNTWRLLPVDGPDVVVDAGACSTGATAARGVWLLVVDVDGRAELVAPSTTTLADGAPDHIALRACEQASGRDLAVPPDVLALLTANTGAIYVDD